MTEAEAPTLHALLIGPGSAPSGSSILVRHWRSVDVDVPSDLLGEPLQACRLGQAAIDTSPLIWADVLVLRNWYATAAACLGCDLASLDEAILREHAAASGHEWRRPFEGLVRALLQALDREPFLLRGRGLVYELDVDPWLLTDDRVGDILGLSLELDLVRHLLRSADVVVATSPEAAAAARREGAPDVAMVPSAAGDVPARGSAWLRAAARAGTGRLLTAGAPATSVAATAAEARRRLEHRREVRRLDAIAAATISRRREAGLSSWDDADAIDPLVSVIIATLDEPIEMTERAILSALDTEGVRVEIILAGLAGSSAAAAIERIGDPRVRLVEVAEPATSTEFARGSQEWRDSAWATAITAAADAALGTWIVRSGEVVGRVGSWPPTPDSVADDASLIAVSLRVLRPDVDSWRDGERPAWNLWRRYLEIGARIGNIEEPITLRNAPDGALSGAGSCGRDA